MKKLEIYEPPMCCSSGGCGADINPLLPRFDGDLEWVKSKGIAVSRYNLAQQPEAFAGNKAVNAALTADETCLPLILVDGRIALRDKYPTRSELAAFLGLTDESEPECCCCSQKTAGKSSKCCG